jgi:hypothetical protein
VSRASKWRWFWTSWLAAFVVLDIVAGSDSLSRTLGRMFPKRVRRALLVALLSLLSWHFWLQPQVGPALVPLTELP